MFEIPSFDRRHIAPACIPVSHPDRMGHQERDEPEDGGPGLAAGAEQPQSGDDIAALNDEHSLKAAGTGAPKGAGETRFAWHGDAVGSVGGLQT